METKILVMDQEGLVMVVRIFAFTFDLDLEK